MKIFHFLKSKAFIKHFIIAIALVSIIIYGVLVSLDIYTNHGDYITVPDFSGINKTESQKIAKKNNLRIVVIDSLYVKNSKAGNVIDQHPQAGHEVKENRLIMLTVCSSKPRTVPFPDLKNSAYRQTLNTLNSLGFKVGKISYTDSKYKNLVLQLKYRNDTIAPNTHIAEGAVIDIVLGRGINNTVAIPMVLGKTFDKAKEEINFSFLNVGAVYYDPSVKTEEDKLKATVWKQAPEYAPVSIDAGRKITLWLTCDKDRKTEADTLIERYKKENQ